MLLFILHFLRETCGFNIPVSLEYTSTRMALAAIFSLLTTILCGKRFIKRLYELKIGDRVRMEDCPLLGSLHQKKTDTPTMGGILILFSLLLSLLLWMDLKSPFTLILLLTTILTGSIGAFDDYLKLKYKNKKGMSAKFKFFSLVSFSLAIALYLLWAPFTELIHGGSWFPPPLAKELSDASLTEMATLSTQEWASRLYVPFLKMPLLSLQGIGLIAMALLIIFVITGSSNAVNLTDGLDGLAAGTVMLAASSFALIAFVSNHLAISGYLQILYIEGSGEIAIYLAAVVGATLGFLWYNGHPAQVFMGDTGSLALGAILGVSSILLKRELLLSIIGGVFVLEALSVILQVGSFKLRNKKRIFLIAPLHHHFEYKGLSETKVVMRFWIAGLLFALIGIATLKLQ
jgi:phospho-N-acetylmuramoyl-pentapeptide-transferase